MNAKSFAAVIPALFALVSVMLANIPITLFGGSIPSPLFALMPIYFWCLVRPDLISPTWAFIVGVLQDILSGGPPGIWAVSFVVMYAVTDRQRDTLAGLAGGGAILGFATSVLVASATAYVTYGVYYWKALPLSPFVVQFAVSVLMYIPAAFVLGFVHRQFVGPPRSDM
jgi:rod shape-determining protein MreD